MMGVQQGLGPRYSKYKDFLKQFLLFGLVALLAACSSGGNKGGDEEEPPTGGGPTVGQVEGVLLSGSDSSPAADNTEDLAPKAVAPEYILDDLLITRLVAVLDSESTVAEVNQALEDNEATIVTMVAGLPFVTLAIDPVADRAEADAKAQALMDSGVFVYVRPAKQLRQRLPETFSTVTSNKLSLAANNNINNVPLNSFAKDTFPAHNFLTNQFSIINAPIEPAEGYVDHVLPSRFPAVWNLERVAEQDATLMITALYSNLAEVGPYNQLPDLTVLDSGTPIATNDPVFSIIGNEGYFYLGIAAGEEIFIDGAYDKLGTNPVANANLNVYGLNINGLDEVDYLVSIYFNWPTSINTVFMGAQNYNDPDQEYTSYLERAWNGFFWRRMAHTIESEFGPFIQIIPTGQVDEDSTLVDDGNFNSPYAVAALENITALPYLDESATDAERQTFLDFYNTTVANNPEVTVPLTNILLVGSSDENGVESSFSVTGADIRALGENVVGPCVVVNNNYCANTNSTLTENTSAAAAAQVAGLASYLWTIDNSLTQQDLLLRLQHAYSSSGTPGLIDAWTAVLSLDESLTNPTVRMAMLDVSGTGGVPDGVFDEDDIATFLEAFNAFEGASQPDWSRYDLNANGWTNNGAGARMDLDVNNLPGFSVVTQMVVNNEKSFNEANIKDTEVLCYYAFSPLYQGEVEDLPEIPDCQEPPPPAQVSTLDGRSIAVVESYGAQDTQEDNRDPDSLESFSVTSMVTLDNDPEFVGASGDASGTENFTMVETPQGPVVFTLNYDGNSNATASHNGYIGPAKGVTSTTSSVVEATFYISEPLNYRLYGSFSGGGDLYNSSQGGGKGGGAISVTRQSNGFLNIFIDQYDSDVDGPGFVVEESGVLPAGFYSMSVNTSASAVTAANPGGGSYNGFSSNEFVLELSR